MTVIVSPGQTGAHLTWAPPTLTSAVLCSIVLTSALTKHSGEIGRVQARPGGAEAGGRVSVSLSGTA